MKSMFKSWCRSNICEMPVSLSEWRVRIGTYVPRMNLVNTVADGESNVDPSDKKEMGPKATTDHQSSTDKTLSKPEKGDSSDEQTTPTATADNSKSMPLKQSKRRKHRNRKGSCVSGQSSGAFLSFRCFMKSGASPLLRFMLLVFTTILLVRSGDVEVNPGPNETIPDGTLLDIAKRIPQDKMYDLGIRLGVDLSALMRYHATNTLGGTVNLGGTLRMLVDWRDDTTSQQQEALLRNALNTSSLHAVAEEYFSKDPPPVGEISSLVPNCPVQHATAGRQNAPQEMPNIESSFPSQQLTYPNQEAIANSSGMYYNQSHDTAYATSRAYQGSDSYRHQEGYFSQQMTNPVYEATANSSGMYYNQSHDTTYAATRAYQGPDSSRHQGGYFSQRMTNPVHEATANSSGMYYNQSHDTTYMYAATRAYQGPDSSTYHGGFLSQPNQYRPPGATIPLGGLPLSHQIEPDVRQSQGPRMTSIQPIDLSLYLSGQLPPQTSEELSNLHTGAGNTPFYTHTVSSHSGVPNSLPLQPNTCETSGQSRLTISNTNPPSGQLASIGGAPCQSIPHTDSSAGALPTTSQGMLNTNQNTQSTPTVSSNSGMFLAQNCMPSLYPWQPHTFKPPGQSFLTPSNNSTSSDQMSLCGGVSSHSCTHTDVAVVSNITSQQRSVHNLNPNTQGSTSTSSSFQESPFPNASGIPLNNLSSEQAALSTQQSSLTGAGAYPMTIQPGAPNMAPHMSLTVPYVPGMSSYQSRQEPAITHSNTATSDVHHAYEIPPITDAQLEQCKEEIKAFYDINLCQIPTSPLDTDSLVELKCIFTNLVLLEENRTTKKKIHLAYKDLLDIKINNQTAKRIMIEGEAGVGKTTFCAKIALDWITREFYHEYALVAVIPLRDAKNRKTVGQVLKTYLSDDNSVTPKQLDEYIQTNQDKVLIVFDGFDEFGVEMSNEANEIVQILTGEKHKSGTVIVTTRPWKAHEISNNMSLRKQYAFVRIEGFKKKDVKTYVTKFFKDDQISAQSLLEFLEEGSLITETMAPFPIFCSMLCHMWKEVEKREVIRKLETFSQLFQEMIMLLKQHYVSKHTTALDGDSVEIIGERIDGNFKKISEVAFNGLLFKQLVFPEEIFVSCVEDLRVACEVGLLTKERTKRKRDEPVRKLSRLESTVSFPHKLFQEYTAGIYLQELFHSNVEEFNHQMKIRILKNPGEFRYLLYFLGSFDEEIAKYIMTSLMDRGQCKLNFIVEVALECQSEQAANLIEAKHPEINHQLTIKKGTRRHVIAGYIFTFTHLISLSVETFCSSKALSRIIADTVCSLQTLKELKISYCNLFDQFIKNLQEHAEAVMAESLEIHGQNISESASQHLVASMCSMPFLKNVKLLGILSDGLHSALREGASSLKIEQMHLMKASGDTSLLSAIALMPNLKSLTLFNTRINDNRKHTEEEGGDPSDTHSSASLTELNVDHDSFISCYGIGLLKRFPCIQKMTLAYPDQTPFPQQLLHYVTMSDVTDLSLTGYIGSEFANLTIVPLEPFPNLINLSLINLKFWNVQCSAILDSLRNNETLKTISIKDCGTNAMLDPLCNKINAEGKMTVTVEHGHCKEVELGVIFNKL